MTAGPRLARRPGEPRRQERIAHLGLGGFFRAHQAWYTDRASDAEGWGICAFSGRRPDLVDALTPQGGLYTLVTRGEQGDRFDVVRSLSSVHVGTDHASWLACARSPALAVVTLTVTEAGHHLGPDRSLDESDAQVRRDVRALREDPTAPVVTMPARLYAALLARERAGLGPVAVVPCDNLPENGAAVHAAVRDLAWAVAPDTVAVVERTASFVTTMVDRITPRTTDADLRCVAEKAGVLDAAPVVTEPFSEWVLTGSFPSGRPAWESSGVTFADSVEPFEQRKLRLLNAAHSLLAYAGSARGHETVDEAIADPVCRGWVEDLWDEADRHLAMPADQVRGYRTALLARFLNPRIRHRLAQIAADGSQKLPVRILPTLRAELAAGRLPPGACRALAAWICHLRGCGAPVQDPQAERWISLARGTPGEAARAVLDCLAPDLAGHGPLHDAVVTGVMDLCAWH